MKKLGLIIIFLFGTILIVNAQSTPAVSKHQVRQQQRIAEGVKSGELTRHERKQLKRQQRHINRTKHRAKADGVVTPAERAHIRNEQKRANRNIYRQKHDPQGR